MTHRHNMEMTFPNGGLDQLFVCECGVQTTSVAEALRLNGEEPTPADRHARYALLYSVGPKTIGALVRGTEMHQDLERRHRRYIWLLRGTMLCALGTLYFLITHPSWDTTACFSVASVIMLLILMNPPRMR